MTEAIAQLEEVQSFVNLMTLEESRWSKVCFQAQLAPSKQEILTPSKEAREAREKQLLL
jgi:hypothetical protein